MDRALHFFKERFHEDTTERYPKFFQMYQEFKEMIREGKHGVIPQFWLCLYLDLIEIQQMTSQTVQENLLIASFLLEILSFWVILHRS